MDGPLIIPGAVREHEDYNQHDADSIVACQDSVYNRFLSYIFLEQADQSKYGSLCTGLSTQHSLQNDQYPKTMSQATSVLSSHHFDQAYFQKKRRNRDRKTRTKIPMRTAIHPTCQCHSHRLKDGVMHAERKAI